MPIIGILSSLYGFYLVGVGIREMHGVSSCPWWRRRWLEKRRLCEARAPLVLVSGLIVLALIGAVYQSIST